MIAAYCIGFVICALIVGYTNPDTEDWSLKDRLMLCLIVSAWPVYVPFAIGSLLGEALNKAVKNG